MKITSSIRHVKIPPLQQQQQSLHTTHIISDSRNDPITLQLQLHRKALLDVAPKSYITKKSESAFTKAQHYQRVSTIILQLIVQTNNLIIAAIKSIKLICIALLFHTYKKNPAYIAIPKRFIILVVTVIHNFYTMTIVHSKLNPLMARCIGFSYMCSSLND